MNILSQKNILIISPEAWGTSLLSKHHYAITLVNAGNRVWFLQPPSAKLLSPIQAAISGLTLVDDTYTVRGVRYMPSRLRKFIFQKQAGKLKRDHHVEFDVVWSFDNSRFYDLTCFGATYTIHHMMDFHVDYNTAEACRTAQLCIGVSASIVGKLRKFNRNSHFIHHGFQPYDTGDSKLPPESQKIKAIYAGNLLIKFINWDWFRALIRGNRDVHFYLAGSYGISHFNPKMSDSALTEVMQIEKEPNVTLLGEVPPQTLQDYFHDADILFSAYRSKEFPEIISNSHKLMSYIGSGKPIVSDYNSAYSDQKDLIYMASDLKSYLDMFQQIKQNLNHYNSEALREMRRSWALNNSYRRQLERIDKLLGSSVNE